MPRAIDLTQAPPPEAPCFSCGQVVKLDRRARARAKFRCPICRADNRIGADGEGQPLDGVAERVADMPQVRCTACGATNRLPHYILRRRSYTCHACHSVEPVPVTLQRRAGLVAWWQVVLLLAVIAGAVAWGFSRTAAAIATARLPAIGEAPTEEADTGDELVIEGAERLGNLSDGQHYSVTGRVLNPYDGHATLHIRAELYDGRRPIAARTVSLVNIAPGSWRRFRVIVIDRQRRRVDAVAVSVVGVS